MIPYCGMSIGRFQVHMNRLCIGLLLVAGAAAVAAERIRIGAEDNWSPYSSVSNGKPVGFAVDVVRAAWVAAGVDVELVPLPYARCMKDVDRGVLAGCFDTLRDPILESKYRWHAQPLFRARIGIYGRVATESVRTDLSLADLRGKRIGVTRRVCSTSVNTKSAMPARKASTAPSNSSRPMPVGFATSPTTGQGFCFIAASWIWVGFEEKITVKLTKSLYFFLSRLSGYRAHRHTV